MFVHVACRSILYLYVFPTLFLRKAVCDVLDRLFFIINSRSQRSFFDIHSSKLYLLFISFINKPFLSIFHFFTVQENDYLLHFYSTLLCSQNDISAPNRLVGLQEVILFQAVAVLSLFTSRGIYTKVTAAAYLLGVVAVLGAGVLYLGTQKRVIIFIQSVIGMLSFAHLPNL